jgi:CheY-like chemotaxis protein
MTPELTTQAGRAMATVLVVDDEDALVELITEVLTDEGHEVLTASNGLDALEILEAQDQAPDCILSDVMMPRLDGLELVRRVRANTRLARVPIVLMSAVRRNVSGVGIDGFLAKPFRIERLLDMIGPYLSKGTL